MPTARLTKRTADAAQPGPKPFILYDEDVAGFGLRVMPSGFKSWILEYRAHGGGRRAPNRRMVLGPSSTMTAEQARKAAKDALAAVRLGADPAGDRQKSREMPTFGEFSERFISEYCVPPRIKLRTVRLYADNVRRVAEPLHKMKLDVITKADVARLHRRVGKDRPTTANNLLVTLASLFKFAAAEGLLPEGTNPARGVARYKARPMERYLSGEEFARLGDALREAETVGLPWYERVTDPAKAKHRPKRNVVIPPDVAAALRLLLFTGCRRGEILGLRWPEVDIERGMLLLADSKTGRRAVVLSAPALQILAGLPRVGEFVFPGQDAGAARADITGFWYRVRARAGLDGSDGKPALRLHDLRHSFASVGASGGMGLPLVGKLLGHTQSSTTQRYAHLDADPVRKAADRIGAAIAAAIAPSADTPSNVSPLSRRGGRNV